MLEEVLSFGVDLFLDLWAGQGFRALLLVLGFVAGIGLSWWLLTA